MGKRITLDNPHLHKVGENQYILSRPTYNITYEKAICNNPACGKDYLRRVDIETSQYCTVKCKNGVRGREDDRDPREEVIVIPKVISSDIGLYLLIGRMGLGYGGGQQVRANSGIREVARVLTRPGWNKAY